MINYYYRKKKTQEKPATSSEQEKDYSGLERIGIFAFGSALFLGAAVLFVGLHLLVRRGTIVVA